MTITARFNGPGSLVDPDGDTTTDDEIAEGGTFETTAKRLSALQEQGIDVTKVAAPKADTSTNGGQS